MAHATAFTITPELQSAFDSPSDDTAALKVVIDVEREVFSLHSKAVRTGSGDAADFEAMKTTVLASADTACYVLFRAADASWAFYSFVPDTAVVKQKMLHASSRATLLKKLGGPERISKDFDCKELDDVVLSDGAAKSDAERKAEQRVLMTQVERMKLDADQLMAVEAAGEKLSSAAGLSFPMTADAAAAFAAFKAGSVGVLLLAIAGEQVTLKAQADAASPAELAKLIPAGDACYCLYRWSHERDGAPTTAVLFLYMCDESAPVRSKMLHASTKGPFLQSLGASGLEVAKAIEGVEPSELTEAELSSQLYGAAPGSEPSQPTITKAAPKGGRRLVKRTNKPVDVSDT